ncbi:MAG TPA: nucleotidyltransferase family protein [Pyrinomonadaceae bacterium]|nr:nucleotidyltransferase family protein [Pyrinomonadaceae bacterium]
MLDSAAHSRGLLIAGALVGSWRADPPAWQPEAAELDPIALQLLTSGVGALVWRRLRSSPISTIQIAEALHHLYRLNTVLAVLHRQRIEQLVSLLRAAGVELMLVKGWTAARLYPDEGLRPYSDIDLVIHPRHFATAKNALRDSDNQYDADLHVGFAKFGGGSCEEIFARARLLNVGSAEVLVPSLEDQLRILAIHMLREGAWRPLWLCDVAAAVESRPDNFNWDVCRGGNRRWADWVTCALRLAHELLGAEISGTPVAASNAPLPRWVVPTILNEWGSLQPSMTKRHRAPMITYWRNPSEVLAGFRHRWPNPIEATIDLGGSFNGLPRLPFQLGSYVARGAKFAVRLPRLLRET